MLTLHPHPKLDVAAFTTRFSAPLGEIVTPRWLLEMLDPSFEAPLSRSDDTKRAVRDMLRTHGYKPSGRGKPASEYLASAASKDALSTINLAVDVCNVVSLHSGIPISVVDTQRAAAPLAVDVAPEGSSYVFNASGQEIQLDGIPCLFDASGPCANAVRDSERTKTRADTRSTISIIWGTADLPGRAADVKRWYVELLERLGAEIDDVEIGGVS